MKTIKTPILVLIGLLLGLLAQSQNRCNHKIPFGKSLISDTLDAQHYYIHLTVTDFSGHEISGFTDVELSSKLDGIDEIKLELQDLTVDSVFVDDVLIPGFSHIGQIITIPLDNPLNTGDNALARVYYHGVPFHESWGGFHYSGEYAFNLGVGFESIPHNLGKTWFPCIDDFHDRALYDVYATVEDAKDAVCGGLLVDVADNGNGTHTFHWKLNNTIPTYLASLAIGDYAKWEGVYSGINGDIPIEIWVKPNDSSKVDGSFEHLNEILAIYEDKFGPYRWERIGYVGTAIGAMEHVTNIAFPSFLINGGLSGESTMAHELAHMWFGDNATCASAEDMWINEGWAVFCEAIFREFLYSKAEANEFIMGKHAEVLQFCHTPSGDGSYFPLNEIPQEITYGMTAYQRGMTVAHTLRGYLGDEVFFDAMAAYNENFKYDYVSSYDMRDFLTAHTGVDMADWFDAWVFNSGTPHFSVDSFAVTPTGNGADVTVFMRQKRHGPEYVANSNIVELSFMDNDWNLYSEKIQFDGETGSPVVQVPFVPEMVFCDLYEKTCDATTDFAQVVKEPGDPDFPETYFGLEVQSITDSAFVRVVHNWAPPDPLKNPVPGLTISDYRYWKIDGVFPEGFEATGRFWYNKNGYLDDGIIQSQEDSVVLVYRENSADDWHFINYTQVGIWSIGNFYVDNLQPGQYCIAVTDDTFVGIPENKPVSLPLLKVYPNPSSSVFRIETTQSGILKFYDINGKTVDTINVENGGQSIKWKPDNLPAGTYFVRMLSGQNKALAYGRLVIIE
ncbi:MAG: T9SS type A sorting domain-containing protein [Chlorobi bacterium]|nr:T9SS type A sorting domain-containing protein [Chlorobiota bacterium]